MNWFTYYGLKLIDLHEVIILKVWHCTLLQFLFLNCVLPIQCVKVNKTKYIKWMSNLIQNTSNICFIHKNKYS